MRWNKYIAPVAVTVLLALYPIGAVVLFAAVPGLPPLLRAAAAVVPLPLIGLLVYVLLQRVREIKSGEEDDLDKF